MGTVITLTPPNGQPETIYEYETCNITMNITDKAGSFSVVLPFKWDTDIKRFGIGTDVQINQNGHIFRGWVIKPPVSRDGAVKIVTLEGADYTAKTQKIIVTESYKAVSISAIVADLFTKYVPWATLNNLGVNDRLLTIKFPDTFLWDSMEKICNLSGFDWYIDENLDLNFFEVANKINENIIKDNVFKRGTANFMPDSSKLVNKLWVKGAKGVSLPFYQNINVGNEPILLFYRPSNINSDIEIIVDGMTKTFGMQNVHKPGIYDFLVNYNEKLLIPDLCQNGAGTIRYRYEYPIKILLENEESKKIYGEFEDILNVDVEDNSLAREIGSRYIEKYSSPIITGTIEPISGLYKCGELIKIELNEFYINDYLVIKSVNYESIAGTGLVNIKLSLENVQRDLTNIIKDINKRLMRLESVLLGDDTESIVEKYKTQLDTIIYPKLSDDDGINYRLHDYLKCGPNLVAGTFNI